MAASLAVLVGAAVVGPFALGVAVPGQADLGFHAALIESQYAAWQTLGRPSPFVSGLEGSERFFPLLAVYGGPAYGLAALVRFALPLQATVVTLMGLAWAGLSWGTYRCARSARVTPQMSLFLAVTVVASGQSVGTVYSRMAFAELIAVSAVAVLAGSTSALWVCWRQRPGCVPLAILSGFVLVGGHPLTLVWSAATAVLIGGVVVVTMRPQLDLRGRWRALLPGSVGGLLATTSWPMAATVFRSTRGPDPREYLANSYFFEPFGIGSGGRVVELLNPLRPSVGPAQLAPYRPAVPALLILAVVALIVIVRTVPSRRARTFAAVTCLACGAAIMLLPQSRALSTALWPIATMQYHWRIYTYATAFVVAAAVIALGRLGPAHRPIATRLMAAVACIELLVAAVQLSNSYSDIPDPVTSSEIPVLVELRPNPVLRNDAELLRSASLQIGSPGTVVASPSTPTLDPEAPMVIGAPQTRRFTIPVVAAPPLITLSEGFRAVGWSPIAPADPMHGAERLRSPLPYEGRQLWLVVENHSGGDELVVTAASDGVTGFTRRALGPTSAVLLLLVSATSLLAVLRTIRRVAPQLRGR